MGRRSPPAPRLRKQGSKVKTGLERRIKTVEEAREVIVVLAPGERG
ncbi:MAG: hypothetical protein ACM3ZO_01100 [Clostridia bacterium]